MLSADAPFISTPQAFVVRFVSSWQLWHVKNSPQHGAFTLHLPHRHTSCARRSHVKLLPGVQERDANGPKRGTHTRRGQKPPSIVLAALRVVVAECHIRTRLRRHLTGLFFSRFFRRKKNMGQVGTGGAGTRPACGFCTPRRLKR